MMIGDSTTRFVKNVEDSRIELSDTTGYSESVMANVEDFIKVFFNVYNSQSPYFTKEEVLQCLKYVEGDPKLNFTNILSDSMFFQYISLLMEQLSIKMLDKMK